MLPDKPSELIRLALADLAKVEAQPEQFLVNMNSWYWEPKPDPGEPTKPRCEVCLAGAVMATRLSDLTQLVKRDEHDDGLTAWPEAFGDPVLANKLNALNEFRVGLIQVGFRSLGLPLPEGCLAETDITEYEEDPVEFRSDMEELAEYLEKLGF